MKLSYTFRCALLASVLFIAVKLTVFFTHTQFTPTGAYVGLLSLGLIIIPLFLGIKYKRDHQLGGFITLRRATLTGVAISVLACLLVALYTFVHYTFIDKEVITYWTNEARRLGAKENKSEAEIQAAITMLTEFYSPFKQATVALIGVLGTGTVLSFILATFLAKKPDISDN